MTASLPNVGRVEKEVLDSDLLEERLLGTYSLLIHCYVTFQMRLQLQCAKLLTCVCQVATSNNVRCMSTHAGTIEDLDRDVDGNGIDQRYLPQVGWWVARCRVAHAIQCFAQPLACFSVLFLSMFPIPTPP